MITIDKVISVLKSCSKVSDLIIKPGDVYILSFLYNNSNRLVLGFSQEDGVYLDLSPIGMNGRGLRYSSSNLPSLEDLLDICDMFINYASSGGCRVVKSSQ